MSPNWKETGRCPEELDYCEGRGKENTVELEDRLGVSGTFSAVLKIFEYYLNCNGRTLHIFMWLNNMMTSTFLKDHISVISYGIWDG